MQAAARMAAALQNLQRHLSQGAGTLVQLQAQRHAISTSAMASCAMASAQPMPSSTDHWAASLSGGGLGVVTLRRDKAMNAFDLGAQP